MLNFELDTIDEKREAAAIQIAYYKQQVARYYNKNICTRTFQVGDWVLKKVFQNTRETGVGKLGPNWEGPYEVTKGIGNGTQCIFADTMFEQSLLSYFSFNFIHSFS